MLRVSLLQYHDCILIECIMGYSCININSNLKVVIIGGCPKKSCVLGKT